MTNDSYRPFRISSDKKWLKINLDDLGLDDLNNNLFSTVRNEGSLFARILSDFIAKHKQAAGTYGKTLVPFMNNWKFIVDALCFEALVRWWKNKDTPVGRAAWTAQKYMISNKAAKEKHFSKPTLIQRVHPKPNTTDVFWEYAYKMIFKLYGRQLGFEKADAERQRETLTYILTTGLQAFVNYHDKRDTWRIAAAQQFLKNPDKFINQQQIGEQIADASANEKQSLLEHAIRNDDHELVTLIASHM